jgi:hypothetical protein
MLLLLCREMPQLDFFSFWSLTVSTIILFIVLIYLFQNFLLPKIAETLKCRRITFKSAKVDLVSNEFEDVITPLVTIIKNKENVINTKGNVY